MIEQQIFSIHADDLQAVQIKLNAIATSDEYKDLSAEYNTRKWAQQRYEELLANAYPTLFNIFEFSGKSI
ncbi:hypothetical protein [Iningainema tapete]|uniref:Uncharacterized protein n=1 Tax=Iningainema tapete BLCC-T55 TaxID=2748662 RepID=A0A8J7C008_9CYAN|nr:hypothetical protein [Iningainema tapete]MBD2778877.1 hypothetical protein [Iningainema tapete BLCC-T55]